MTKDKIEPFALWDKPSWDDCFMGIALTTAILSPDPSTKHGAVIVDEHHRIKSLGFNGFPPNCDDMKMPTYRPFKYLLVEHAERNALNNAEFSVEGCTVYVTGYPCAPCFRSLLCRRISKIIYGAIGSICVTEEDKQAIEIMNRTKLGFKKRIEYKIEMIPYLGDPTTCLKRATEYYNIKMQNCESIQDH